MSVKSMLKGAGIGAVLMYVFDPERGRRRRALLCDQYDHAIHSLEDYLSKVQRDLSHRATGLSHEAAAMVRSEGVDDRVLVDRVRSKLGRYVSHPHAIRVEAHDGHVVLSGTVLADEVDDAVGAVRWVRGIRSVESRLESHQQSGNLAALQGGRQRSGETRGVLQDNWNPATRALAQVGGLALMTTCLGRRGLSSTLLGTAGLALFVRAAANRSFAQLTGYSTCPQAVTVQRTTVIQAPVEKVWEFMNDFELVGRFMPSTKAVEKLGEDHYRWTMAVPGGEDLQLEERVTERVMNERLSWESVSDRPVSYSGWVLLQQEGEGATRANVHFEYTPPGGVLADRIAHLFGLDPESQLHDAVMRIKTYLETGTLPHDVAAESSHAS